jgi:hypothetical protein
MRLWGYERPLFLSIGTLKEVALPFLMLNMKNSWCSVRRPVVTYQLHALPPVEFDHLIHLPNHSCRTSKTEMNNFAYLTHMHTIALQLPSRCWWVAVHLCSFDSQLRSLSWWVPYHSFTCLRAFPMQTVLDSGLQSQFCCAFETMVAVITEQGGRFGNQHIFENLLYAGHCANGAHFLK